MYLTGICRTKPAYPSIRKFKATKNSAWNNIEPGGEEGAQGFPAGTFTIFRRRLLRFLAQKLGSTTLKITVSLTISIGEEHRSAGESSLAKHAARFL